MIRIYLIRHGQASFAEQDYDKLSIKGIEQAKILGRFWQQLPITLSEASGDMQYYSGSLLRHEQTAEHFFKGLSENNVSATSTPSIITHSGFNELDHVDILSRYNESWQSFQAMCNTIKQEHTRDHNHDKPQVSREFQQAFSQAMSRWISGDFDSDYQESWPQFKQRCLITLKNIISEAHSKPEEHEKNLVVFTSGGVIGVLLGHILQLSNQHTLQISQQLINSSVTKVIATNEGFRLSYLNNYSHLEVAGQEWLSYF